MPPPPDSLLDERSAGPYLRERGLLPDLPDIVRPLGGGVSNLVLFAQCGDHRVVVKQSLPRLRVAGRWEAKRDRLLTEAAALKLIDSITPGAAPRVLAVDPSAYVLVIEAAPEGWGTWKPELLDGVVRPEIGARLGTLLGTWHEVSRHREVPHDAEAFEQLRLAPYHRTVAAHHPALAGRILEAVEQLRTVQRCFVHGDYSPKNVLVSPGGTELWIIDCEVAHRGHPVFDLAFLSSHLLLKALHRPRSAAALRVTAERFLTSYGEATSHHPESGVLALHVGCLLLARVDGKSPAAYLSDEERARVRALATAALEEPGATLEELWDRFLDACHGASGMRT